MLALTQAFSSYWRELVGGGKFIQEIPIKYVQTCTFVQQINKGNALVGHTHLYANLFHGKIHIA